MLWRYNDKASSSNNKDISGQHSHTFIFIITFTYTYYPDHVTTMFLKEKTSTSFHTCKAYPRELVDIIRLEETIIRKYHYPRELVDIIRLEETIIRKYHGKIAIHYFYP